MSPKFHFYSPNLYPLWGVISLSLAAIVLLSLLRCGPSTKPPAEGRELVSLRPPPRNYWPTESWRFAKPQGKGTLPRGQQEKSASDRTEIDRAAAAGMDRAGLAKLERYLFDRQGAEEERKGIRTNALLIVRNGYLVYEKYASGYNKESLHPTWSITKSFVNALFGIAQRENIIDIDKKAYLYYPALNIFEKREITIRHLLNMSSGIAWNEGYEYSPLKSNVIAMLYTRGRSDMAAFIAAQNMRSQPGNYVYYSSGDSNLLMGILKNALPADQHENFPWTKLFEPIGMRRVVWERDQSGNFVGSSYLYTTARDMARFGFLYLNNGKWDGKTILDEDWINFTRRPAPGYALTPQYEGLAAYNLSAHWYTNSGIPAANIEMPWPAAPADTLAALGHWGQSLWLIPSFDAVVVRFADDRDSTFDRNEFLQLISASMKKRGRN